MVDIEKVIYSLNLHNDYFTTSYQNWIICIFRLLHIMNKQPTTTKEKSQTGTVLVVGCFSLLDTRVAG